MSTERRGSRAEVIRLVQSVRRRWRVGVGLRGLGTVVGITGAVLLLSAFGLERLRFTEDAVFWFRVLTWGTFAATAFFFLVRPLLRRVTDAQVALYLEEHEPSLDHVVVSALEADQLARVSPALSRRLVETAMEGARRVEFGRRVEQPRFYRWTGALTALVVTMVSVTLLGPEHLRLGLSALLVPTRDAATVNPYAVAVQPGDVTIARGSDQMVTAQLSGFDAEDVSVFTRSGPDGSFQRLSMLSGEDGGFEILLLGVDDRTEYFVESTGIRSATFAIDVADLPYVDQMDLTYYFPRYTGLPPRTITDGGDVAALPGTVVEVRIQPTMLTPGGQLLMDGTAAEALTVNDDGTLVGRFTVSDPGFYSVDLAREDGAMVTASPEYRIDVLSDNAPSIQFTKPGRDTQASPIEEVYLEIRADDDYGVGDVRLVYSVNGGPEDTTSIFRQGGAPLSEVSVGHTLFLEEYELEAGDLVSFYGLVRDNRTLGETRAVASDIYFLTIRPFERAYREGESQGGGPPQGGQGEMPETALSELQRQIIAATFNLIRQEESYAAEEYSENIVSVALAQARLQDQVANLLQRMQNRGLVETDPGFRDVSAILPLATEAMEEARTRLEDEALRDALPHEQTALRYLQQAEETYERYVVQQQEQAGGGGGGGQDAADDLADLFELELDKLKNQYETVRRGEQQQADDQVDEVLEKLRELSRRQEQEAERQRRRAQRAGQGAPQGGSATQRELAEEAEEAARQLQRLARETGDAELEETARQLQQAAESMRQSASQSASAGAQAGSALDRLEEARRRLEQNRQDRARRDAEDALRQVEDLARQQRQVTSDVRDLPESRQERQQAIEVDRLRERKDQMTEAVSGLERQLDRASQSAASDQPEASRRLGAAAEQIRESKLKEKLQYSRGTIEQWDPAAAATLELDIEGDLQALRQLLEEAEAAAGERQADPLSEALDATRDLVRGMEAMDRRLRESQGEEGQEGQAGQEEGRPGESAGQPGEPQEGQQGQQGQQGQGGGRPGGQPSDQPSDVRDGNATAGGATRGNPQPLTPDEIRQFRSEFNQRGQQARGLRDRLRDAGRDAEDLSAVIAAMEQLQREGIYDNPAQVADLQAQILELLKQLEFGLRREVEGEGDRRATLTGSDEVPEGYRRLVEEYYKALARGGGNGGG